MARDWWMRALGQGGVTAIVVLLIFGACAAVDWMFGKEDDE